MVPSRYATQRASREARVLRCSALDTRLSAPIVPLERLEFFGARLLTLSSRLLDLHQRGISVCSTPTHPFTPLTSFEPPNPWFNGRLSSGLTFVPCVQAAQMGDPNASIPTPQPVVMRPMFGGLGRAVGSTSVAFVSAAAAAAGIREKWPLHACK